MSFVFKGFEGPRYTIRESRIHLSNQGELFESSKHELTKAPWKNVVSGKSQEA